ncbi:MAG: SDR family oxidoreductase [Gemmatimonadota bacterium]
MHLVVGATGALGSSVAGQLLARGHTLRILVRPGSDASALIQAGAEPVEGDLKDPASLARACAGVSAVVTTANSAGRAEPDTVDSVDRAGNLSLIQAAADAGVEHFVFVSAVGASDDSPVPFFQAKAAAERTLRESGMAWTILQPNVFMDVWVGMIVGMPLAEGRPVTLVRPGTHRHTFIAMADVAAFTVAAATSPAARGRTLVVGGPQALSWRDVVQVAEDVVGRPLEVAYVEPGAQLPGLPPMVAAMAAGFETYESAFDTVPLAAEFGVRQTPLASWMAGALSASAEPGGAG